SLGHHGQAPARKASVARRPDFWKLAVRQPRKTEVADANRAIENDPGSRWLVPVCAGYSRTQGNVPQAAEDVRHVCAEEVRQAGRAAVVRAFGRSRDRRLSGSYADRRSTELLRGPGRDHRDATG